MVVRKVVNVTGRYRDVKHVGAASSSLVKHVSTACCET